MRLLIIEDEVEIANLLGRYLGRQGFNITVVHDGEAGVQAFAVADVDGFDVVLTDGLLPRKNGYEVCAAIRALPHGKKTGLVLMSAAFRGAKARTDAYSTGVDAYFTKPFVLTELRDKLKELGARARVGKSQPPTSTSTSTSAPKPAALEERLVPAGPPRKLRKLGPGTVAVPADVAAVLLLAARERFDGVLRFVDGENALQIAFIRGVVVGAGDNLPEHALGEWMRRQGRLTDVQAQALDERLVQTRERVAEALLALGFVTALEALNLVDLQVQARVRRALVWKGAVEVLADADAAVPFATQALDLVDILVRFGLEPIHRSVANTFASARGAERLERSADFDSGLVPFASLRPSSSLPRLLLERDGATVSDVVGRTDSLEVWSLWFAGLLHAERDPPLDERGVPRAVKNSVGTGGLVDGEAVAAVSRVLLRARRASVYQLLDIPPSTSTDLVLRGLRALLATVGREALGNAKLGPASSSARELWTLLDEHVFVFSDERRRQSYDLDFPSITSARPAPSKLLEAQRLVAAGAVAAAAEMLSHYVAAHPDDVEAIALRGHIAFCMGERDRGIALLAHSAHRHPQAVRPLYYQALVAIADGDKDAAREMLAECARRAPGDVDVQRALTMLLQ